MLVQLSVKNLAIVESAEVTFGAGLNIITGETGAGKSVLMGALDLVLGGRADKSAIREGASEAWVEAAFSLADSRAADRLLDDAGLPACEEGALLVRRSIAAAGAGRCLVNDTPATVQTLRRLGSLLVDIHGPYDHQSLLDADFQRDVLDAYGHCASVRDAYGESWRGLQALRARLDDLQGDSADIASEIDRLQFMVDEIAQAELSEADEEPLLAQHAEAANAEQILALGTEICNGLTDGERSAFDLLAEIQTQLAELARILPEAAAWRADAQTAAVQLQELGRAVSDRLSRVEADPDRLQQLEARMALVQRLKRKYGHTVGEVLATLARHQARLYDLATRTEQVERLQAEIAEAADALTRKAAALTKSRAQAAGRLARAITGELHDLGFLKSGFSVDLAACAPGPHGADLVTFGFAPNPGEPMRPLKAIASSGEIARVMLAVKAVLAAHDSIPVLVFDEIDANIGGEVGRVVGQKLRHVAATHQVISITHLPQSAVYGHQHYVVSKEVAKGRTRMRIEALDDARRVDEIARMLGGKGLTSVIESHARELLASASGPQAGQ
ncbi:MAG TPA: DNA repair protein RecN [Kiritimatiellia bacterium]|jgi:DNA repair protein RecN (Recombination protein N)|nr:MAG: DNA repair protein RecN [Verrucomicrobia bacterium ADurb.Bin070]HPO37029.1 DNA repair protein RecN [Kiritimatiellia bacterium]HQA37884.1 DNA repair protein RecN [Kiritimatiellia bacterium]HQL51467.1 DNA repair protein RecN [Kiritimatiellia bacterium]HQQ91013.1 DNA repair protein RecN [Kiritimatiellia bacterium]